MAMMTVFMSMKRRQGYAGFVLVPENVQPVTEIDSIKICLLETKLYVPIVQMGFAGNVAGVKPLINAPP